MTDLGSGTQSTTIILKALLVLGLTVSMASTVRSQSIESDLTFLRNQVKPSIKQSNRYKLEKQETNEIKIGVQLVFLFYKSFLSSQDNQNCSFSPSCSTYCLHAIQKRGVIKGVMSSFDRLSRCNYLSPENYEVDMTSGRLLDPVDDE